MQPPASLKGQGHPRPGLAEEDLGFCIPVSPPFHFGEHSGLIVCLCEPMGLPLPTPLLPSFGSDGLSTPVPVCVAPVKLSCPESSTVSSSDPHQPGKLNGGSGKTGTSTGPSSQIIFEFAFVLKLWPNIL